jgi:SAM-dependent methyltransferase
LEAEYGSHYRELYERHWWWRAREDALMQVLQRHLPRKRPLRLLDVGCGDGLFFDRLAKFGEVEGVEPDAHLVTATGAHAAKIHIAPFDSELQLGHRYDVLLMLDVLEHLDDPNGALRCAHDLLLHGGAFIITVPAFMTLWTNHDVINHHRTRYRRQTLFPLLRGAGFTIVESKYWYQWTVPAKLGTRLAESLSGAQPALPRVPPPWINRLLYRASRIEQQTLGAAGVPFGSTLMAYCVRDGA